MGRIRFLVIFHLIASLEAGRSHYTGNLEKIRQYLEITANENYYPPTIRILQSGLSCRIWKIPIELQLPILLGEFEKNRFKTSTTLYFVFTEVDKLLVESCLKREATNRRWEKVIVIGVESLFRPEILILLDNYRLRAAIDFDAGILYEPSLENPKELVPSSDFENWHKPRSFAANLRRRHLRVAGCEFPPWTMKVREDGKERVWGTHYELVSFASKKINFTFQTNVLDGPNYGELHPNGTWSGMYALIYYRSLNHDFCFMLGHDHFWSADVDYASTFGTIDLVFANAWPRRELKWTAVFEPLQASVWILTFIAFLIFSASIYCFRRFSSEPATWVTSVLNSYALLIEQGVADVKNIKLLLILWLMFVIIITTGYKSTLKSRLTFPSPETLPSDYKELAASDFKIILNAQGVVEKMFFAETKVPEMINIRNRMSQEASTEECVKAAFLYPHFACIGWFPYYKQTVSSTLTLYSRLEPLIYTKQAAHWNSLSMAFQKDSVYVDGFTPVTAALYESGVYHKWEEKVNNYYKEIGRGKVVEAKGSIVYEKLVQLSKFGENVEKPLTMGNVWVVFLMVIFGLSVCCSVFIGELLFVKSLF